jgi:muconate cycloisomerase
MAGRMYLDDIVTRPFEYRDGSLVVPTAPGLGVELDMEKVAEYRVEPGS